MSAQDDEHNNVIQAGEYALHLMDGSDRAAFEVRMLEEPQLRDLVREWDSSLIGLSHSFAPVPAPKYIKKRVQAQLFGTASSGTWLGMSWRGWAGAAAAASVLAAFLLMSNPFSSEPVQIAQILAPDNSLHVQVTWDEDAREMELVRLTGQPLQGRSLQLWLITGPQVTPFSLGVIPQDTPASLSYNFDLSSLLDGATLAISDEPLGGSPTGLPTGEVLGTGKITLAGLD